MSLTPITGAEIKAFRAALGLSQAGLAKALYTPTRTVEDWEAGKTKAPPGYLRLALAAVNERLEPWRATA